LNAVVDRMIFSSVGTRFQMRGAATKNALSPIFRPAASRWDCCCKTNLVNKISV